jgi:hypothetical protein
MRWLKRLFIAGGLIALLACLSLLLPPIRERVVWHLDEWSLRLQYALKPPEKQVFVPQASPDVDLQATLLALPSQPSATPVLPTPTQVAAATATPTPAPTPLPAQVSIQGVPYIDQHGLWNYCAPANLTMALSFWGWQGDRTDVGNWVKPFEKDKNVMPYELADYVNSQTGLAVVERSGGTLELLKRLVAAGFPVLIEKGAYMQDISGKVSWMGHYAVVSGYDDAQAQFVTQDSFYRADFPVSYDELEHGWRAFNDVFLVVYPPERENQVMELLGDYADETQALQLAAQAAGEEIYQLEGVDQFFAWFNRGSSLVGLQDYQGAAQAYDQAFALYAQLPEKDRPWRMMWYQTGPYFAYYYSGRYSDVLTLADQTIEAASEPYIEESFYWRAMAKAALGDPGGAVDDLHTSLEYHPGFAPSVAELSALGVEP